MSGSQGPPPPEQGGVIPPTPVVQTQVRPPPMFQSQPGTPGLWNRGTQAGAQGNQGNATPTAGGGGNNGALSAMDVATLRELVGGNTRLPDMRTVPKIRSKDANLEGVIKYIKLQRYYMQAQHGRADPLTDNRFSDKLPIGGRPGLDMRIANGTATQQEILAMRLNEEAASCLLFGAAECSEISDALQDNWDDIEWPLGHTPQMLQNVLIRYVPEGAAGKTVLEDELRKINWDDSMQP